MDTPKLLSFHFFYYPPRALTSCLISFHLSTKQTTAFLNKSILSTLFIHIMPNKHFLILFACVLALAATAYANEPCGEENYQVVLSRATKLIRRRPPAQCFEDVFNGLCQSCKGNFKCFVMKGKRLAVETSSCQANAQYLMEKTETKQNTVFDVDAEDDDVCSDERFYTALRMKVTKMVGRSVPKRCFSNVYDNLCRSCSRDVQCYLNQGTAVAMKAPACLAPQKRFRDEKNLFYIMDVLDRYKKQTKLGALLAMPHDEDFTHSDTPSDTSAVKDVDQSATPAQPKGPFFPITFPDETNTDLTTLDNVDHADGINVYLLGQVFDAKTRKPIQNATVEIWQACVSGKYNHINDPNPAPIDPDFQYYGIDSTTNAGFYAFKTIIPGAYPATKDWLRPPHIHFLVKAAGHKQLITQSYFHPSSLKNGETINPEFIPENNRNPPRLPPLPPSGPGFLKHVNDHDLILSDLTQTQRDKLLVKFKTIKTTGRRIGVFNLYLDRV